MLLLFELKDTLERLSGLFCCFRQTFNISRNSCFIIILFKKFLQPKFRCLELAMITFNFIFVNIEIF